MLYFCKNMIIFRPKFVDLYFICRLSMKLYLATDLVYFKRTSMMLLSVYNIITSILE